MILTACFNVVSGRSMVGWKQERRLCFQWLILQILKTKPKFSVPLDKLVSLLGRTFIAVLNHNWQIV